MLSAYPNSNWTEILSLLVIFHRVFLNFQCHGKLQALAQNFSNTCCQTSQSDNSPVQPSTCDLQAVNLCSFFSHWTLSSDHFSGHWAQITRIAQTHTESVCAAFLPYEETPQKFSHALGILCTWKTKFELKFIGSNFVCVLNTDFFPPKMAMS